jgi:hypothetical protein
LTYFSKVPRSLKRDVRHAAMLNKFDIMPGYIDQRRFVNHLNRD